MSPSAEITEDTLTIRLPTLSPEQALALTEILDAVITAIWERHDAEIAAFLAAQPPDEIVPDPDVPVPCDDDVLF